MDKFNKLLEKRRLLTASLFEEEELIKMSKKMSDKELEGVDKSLLTYTNSERLDSLTSKLDKLLAKL